MTLNLFVAFAICGSALVACESAPKDPDSNNSPASGGHGGDSTKGIETLFAIGSRASLALNTGRLYWSTQAYIESASADGTGKTTRLANRGVFGPTSVAVDDEHVYWVEADRLYRVPKVGGETSYAQLPWAEMVGAVVLDDDFVYAALPGCGAIVRVRKSSLEAESIYPPNNLPWAVGDTDLLMNGTELLCGGWSRIFAIPSWDAGMNLITEAGYRVTQLGVVGDTIYWLDQAASPHSDVTVWRVPRAGGSAEKLATTTRAGAGEMVVDEKRNRLIYGAGPSLLAPIFGFDLETLKFTEVMPEGTGFGGGLVANADYLYWTTYIRESSGEYNGYIRRARLDPP